MTVVRFENFNGRLKVYVLYITIIRKEVKSTRLRRPNFVDR